MTESNRASDYARQFVEQSGLAAEDIWQLNHDGWGMEFSNDTSKRVEQYVDGLTPEQLFELVWKSPADDLTAAVLSPRDGTAHGVIREMAYYLIEVEVTKLLPQPTYN